TPPPPRRSSHLLKHIHPPCPSDQPQTATDNPVEKLTAIRRAQQIGHDERRQPRHKHRVPQNFEDDRTYIQLLITCNGGDPCKQTCASDLREAFRKFPPDTGIQGT